MGNWQENTVIYFKIKYVNHKTVDKYGYLK